MGGDRIPTRVLTWALSPNYNPSPPPHPQERKRKLLMEILDLSECTSDGVWRLRCTPEYYRVVRSVLNGVTVIRKWLDLTGNPSKSFNGKFSLGLTTLFLNGQMHCIASCGVKYPTFDGKIVLGKIEKNSPHEKHFFACVVM